MNEKNFSFLLSILVLVSCTPVPVDQVPHATQTLVPYYSATPSPQKTPAQFTPAPPTVQASTATPWVHLVQAEDTLLGIALRYGVELADLLAANPDVDPQFLSLDMEIRIPVDGALQEALSADTEAYPLPMSDAACFLAFGNELWCFVSVVNTSNELMEGIAARITLYQSSGEVIADRIMYAPMNLLPPGRIMPLAATFAWDDVSGYSTASVQLVSAFPANQADERYASVGIDEQNVAFSADRTLADWTALVSLQAETTADALRTAVLVIALDDQNRVVGFRKVEIADIQPGAQVTIQTYVYSPEPQIDHLEVLSEAVVVKE